MRPVDKEGLAEWQPAPEITAGARELKYVVRAYDAKGRFDETEAKPLWLVHQASPEAADAAELLAAYGESGLARHAIPLQGGR